MYLYDDIFCPFEQFEVELRDGGGQVASDRATVTVNVIHNSAGPIFIQDVYNVTIDETASISFPVVTVSASDADSNVSSDAKHYVL